MYLADDINFVNINKKKSRMSQFLDFVGMCPENLHRMATSGRERERERATRMLQHVCY